MRALLILLIILVLAALAIIGLQHESGYVIIHLAKTQIELSFWTAAIATLVGFIVLYILVRILVRLFGLGRYFKKRKKNKLVHNSKQLTENGIVESINGRWSTAGNYLEKAAILASSRLLPKLLCAFNFQREGNWDNRDVALNMINPKNKDEQITFQLAKAQMLMGSREWEKALACLKTLHQQNPTHQFATYLLACVCDHLHEWGRLAELLPNLKKNKNLQTSKYVAWQEKSFARRLQLAARQSTNDLSELWDRADRDSKQYLSCKKAYITGLLDLNEFDKAKNELGRMLKKSWDATLCALYETFPATQAEDLILVVDKLCQQHPSERACRRALGVLCNKAKRYVRAKEILTTLVEETPCDVSLRALANAHAGEGEWEKAAGYLLRLG